MIVSIGMAVQHRMITLSRIILIYFYLSMSRPNLWVPKKVDRATVRHRLRQTHPLRGHVNMPITRSRQTNVDAYTEINPNIIKVRNKVPKLRPTDRTDNMNPIDLVAR
jgi:hypothetical protein